MGRLLIVLLFLLAVGSCKHKPYDSVPAAQALDTTVFLIKKATMESGSNILSYCFTYTADHRLDSVFETRGTYEPFVRVMKYMPGYWLRLVSERGSFRIEDSILLNNYGRPASVFNREKKLRRIFNYAFGQLTQVISFQHSSQGYTVDTTDYSYLNGEVDIAFHKAKEDFGIPEPVTTWHTKYFYNEARPFQMGSIPYFDEFRFGNVVDRSINLTAAASTYPEGSGVYTVHHSYTFDSLNRITHATSARDGNIGISYSFYY